MGRCLSPCLGDLDPNLYRRRLDEALRLFVDGGDGGQRLLAHVDGQMRDASAARRLRARPLAAPPGPPARGDPGAVGGRPRGDPHPSAARARRAPGAGRELRCVLDRGRPSRRLGSASDGPGRAPRTHLGGGCPRRPRRRARRSRASRRDRRSPDRRDLPGLAPADAQLALDPAPDAGALESFAYGETSLTGRTAARRPPPELPVLRP